MSRGAGVIEKRIADLLATTRDRTLSVEDVTDAAFELRGQPSSRVQRLSATRAAHRVLRRVRSAHEFAARVGIWPLGLRRAVVGGRTDFWCATTVGKRLWFHPPDVPAQVWAVTIDRAGVHWFDAEIARVTKTNVTVRYRGDVARLDRAKLRHWWAWWRGVRFVSSRTGRIAADLEDIWWKEFGSTGAPPPAMRMPLEQARLLLGLPIDYSKEDVVAAFRRKAKEAHPDLGGTAEQFRLLVEARDRLLAALGTKAPPPKPPNYAPSGVQVVYRRSSGRARQQRLGSGTRRLTSG
jgi:hypothetical protein